jgi:uncharacterized membrane protein
MSRERGLRRLFRIGIFLKAVDGAMEIVGGIFLLLLSKESLNDIVEFLTRHELSEDPRDMVANYMIRLVHHLSDSTQQFGALYLIIHGILKIFLVVALFRNKLWAYPSAMIFLIVFIGYQLYRITLTHSTALVLLSLFDILIVYLIWHEYRYLQRNWDFAGPR